MGCLVSIKEMIPSLDSTYWESRYQNNDIPWDLNEVASPIAQYINQLDNKELKILIPGAGNGYEVSYLWKNGFKNIYIVDLAETPLKNIKRVIPEIPNDRLLNIDFFKLDDTFDLIIEHTFFCALSPLIRENYVKKCHNLLNAHGKIVGLLFSFPLNIERGRPPYGGSYTEYETLFSAYFIKKCMQPATNSHPSRQGSELFINLIKK